MREGETQQAEEQKKNRSNNTTFDRSAKGTPEQATKRKTISETSESDEEPEQPRKKRTTKIIKDEVRSRIAKKNIKFQSRQTSGKFGPKPKPEITPNGKLLMKPVVIMKKIENKEPTKTTRKPERATTSRHGVKEADQAGKPRVTSIVEIPIGEIPIIIPDITIRPENQSEKEKQQPIAQQIMERKTNGLNQEQDTNKGKPMSDTVMEQLQRLMQRDTETSTVRGQQTQTITTTEELREILSQNDNKDINEQQLETTATTTN